MGEPRIKEPDLDDLLDAEPRPKLGLVGLLMLVAANAVWAVVGLVFWVPLLVRAALVSSVRIVHSALTRQPPSYLRGYIRSASRFYFDGFWTWKDLQQTGVRRRHELHFGRFLGEVVWAAAFYLVLLRFLDKERFAEVWNFLAGFAKASWDWLGGLLAAFVTWLPKSLPRLVDSGYLEWAVIMLVLVGAFLGGLALGRKRRRRTK